MAPNYTGRGPLSPLDRTTAPTSPGTLHGQSVLASEDFGHGRSAMGAGGWLGSGGRCASPRGQVDQGLWVTLFGFPQGYQDGMLRILRDRGEIVEHTYAGTNHISVKFKHAEAVADAVGLNGTILPADGLPGENYMIGVKRGAAPMERGAGSSRDAEAAAQRALKSPAVMRPSVAVGAGHDSQRVSEGGLRGSVGRFLSELFDITDLSIRD